MRSINKNEHNFELLLHTEKIYNTRINYFIIFQSIFFAAYLGILKQDTINNPTIYVYVFLCVAMLFTLIWILIDCKTYSKLKRIKDECKKNGEEFFNPTDSILPIPINFLTGIIIPFILFLMWLILFILEIINYFTNIVITYYII
ncbi:MAG: hypothetical protein V1865_03265 [bacterium]